jgi:hypothetical protein
MRQRRRTTSAKPVIPPVEELYGAGVSGRLMKGEYTTRTDIHAAIQRRHERGMALINGKGYWVQGDRQWYVPYGVRQAFTATLSHSHLMNRYPFYVQWRHPDGNGGFRTKKRSCTSLGSAVSFITLRAQQVDEDAFVVCKLGFYAPVPMLGKFPRRLKDGKLYYWCPRCMQPRRFRQHHPQQTFYVNKKYPNTDEKTMHLQPFIWKNVKLALLECTHCGGNNRDGKFRASNQPVQKTIVKARKTRVRRRR